MTDENSLGCVICTSTMKPLKMYSHKNKTGQVVATLYCCDDCLNKLHTIEVKPKQDNDIFTHQG